MFRETWAGVCVHVLDCDIKYISYVNCGPKFESRWCKRPWCGTLGQGPWGSVLGSGHSIGNNCSVAKV